MRKLIDGSATTVKELKELLNNVPEDWGISISGAPFAVGTDDELKFVQIDDAQWMELYWEESDIVVSIERSFYTGGGCMTTIGRISDELYFVCGIWDHAKGDATVDDIEGLVYTTVDPYQYILDGLDIPMLQNVKENYKYEIISAYRDFIRKEDYGNN